MHYGTGRIEPKDNRTCFARKSYLTEPVELCQRDVYIDVSQTIHQSLYNANEKKTCIKLANCITETLPLGHSLVRKNA